MPALLSAANFEPYENAGKWDILFLRFPLRVGGSSKRVAWLPPAS